jgi:hypothetical protein
MWLLLFALAVTVPKTWDDAAMSTLEVPLANPIGSPKQVSAYYYYKVPVRPIYKQYPIYAHGHEPAGYIDWLKQQEPVIVWDDRGHAPPLKTDADWIKAGEIVFGAPVIYEAFLRVLHVRSPEWWTQVGARFASDGTVPGWAYVVTEKGKLAVGALSRSSCHTRLMPDGTALKGAQGNFPFEKMLGAALPGSVPPDVERPTKLEDYAAFAAPWLNPDPAAQILQMPFADIISAHAAIPPGVIARHGTSVFYPVQVPDLIGVKERRYLDRTGLQQNRGIAGLMRYAALNQGGDDLASFAGFIHFGNENFKRRPDPANVGGRYTDDQLYALALYLYSLQPPHDPNNFEAIAARGQKVFQREGCPGCHTPPLYTNNKLTLAEGFILPPDAQKTYDIMPISVGTDPNLTLKTRRGTGYYKVPSLKGVWYRGMFGHSGWCATLEDWFDPGRTRGDYVPTGFKPYGVKTYAVKGHPFGLDLSAEDKTALIAFLKTL